MSTPLPKSGPAPAETAARAGDLLRIALVGLACLVVALRIWEPFPRISPVALLATLWGGWPVFQEAFRHLRKGRMTMELSMTIALLAALAVGEFVTALTILFFVLAAEVLERFTVDRGRHAIRDLLDLGTRRTVPLRGREAHEIDADEVRIGDEIIVKPGSRLPADGIVVGGHSFVDQSSITGESLPVEKVPGAEVHAGTFNQSGALEVRVTRVGEDTTFGKIIEAVERAERTRAPVQKLADRLAGWIVYFALACAALTFLLTRDLRSTISVVIVAGACGIATGTPLAILGAIGQAARNGVIIKGGIHLETLATVDTVLLDKTGTLTFGIPEVVGVHPAAGGSRRILLGTAAIAARPSEHPLARAILRRSADERLETTGPERFSSVPGKGIVCAVGGEEIVMGSRLFLTEHRIRIDELPESAGSFSEVLVSRGGRLLGSLRFEDVVRPEAYQAVRALREAGLRTVLVSGDAAGIAETIGGSLGVDEIRGALLPEGKLERVETLMAEGRRVAMIGDGINDAPALMTASVGVAMGSGTDVAVESAAIVLLGNDLLKFVETLRLARRCRRIILTNFAGTLLLDGVGLGLAAAGLLSPVVAAFIHVVSELVFILNSARLLPAAGPARAI